MCALVALTVAPAALAQNPLATLFGTDAGPATCDHIAAQAAAWQFHVFAGVSAVLAALVATGVWWVLDRRGTSTWLVRLLVGTQVGGALAFAIIALRPALGSGLVSFLDNPACAAHFLLGSLGAYAQGLVLGLAPAEALTFGLIVVVRNLISR